MYRSLGIILLGLLIHPTAIAETLQLGTLPTKPTKLGFTMTVKLEAVSGNGYRPVHLTFAPQSKTFQRDRHVEVAISPRQPYNGPFDYTFRKSITLPEKSGVVDEIVYVPRYYQWTNIEFELREDGRPVESGLATFGSGTDLRFNFANQQVTVGIIQPKDAANQNAPWKIYPDVRTLVTVLGDGPIPESSQELPAKTPVASQLSHLQSVNLAKQVQPAWVQFRPLEENHLPDNWLGFTQLDVILVPDPVLDRIATEQPDRMLQLKLWLAAGGNLWVYAAGEDSGVFTDEAMPMKVSTQQMLASGDLSELDLSAANDTSPLVFAGWNDTQKESQHYSYRGDRITMSRRRDVYESLKKANHPFARNVSAKELATGLRRGSYGLGEVITIANEDPFPGSFQLWKSIANLQGKTRLQWPDRIGVDVPAGNNTYWTWLIRSVGQPPVKSFVILNLLFAIVTGPFCYFLLRQRERLYLLYFVAPCLAAMVTIGLFAYALASDGITTKQRTRQISWIDPTNSFHVSQSRSTYYRVLGYGQNIQVARDTAIYPVHHSPTNSPYYGRNSGEVVLHGDYRDTADQQLLGGGFLPTRNQVQYLTIRPWRSEKSIDIDWKSQQVTNYLPYTIRQLLICDDSGKCWVAANLTTGTTVPLTPCKQISELLDQILGPNVLPDQADIPMINTYNWTRNNVGSQVSLLEGRLDRWSKRLPNNSFLGVAEVNEQNLGIVDGSLVDSVHIVMGRLP